MPAHPIAHLFPSDRQPGKRRLGLEMHVRVLEDDHPVDPRRALSRLATVGIAADPRDPAWRVLPSGTLISDSGPDLKLSTPPHSLGAATADDVLALATAERDWVQTHLQLDIAGQSRLRLEIVAYQVNISASDELLPALAGEFARRCALALALVVGIDERGIQIRPRRHRLEITVPAASTDNMLGALTLITACALLLEEGRWMAEALPQEKVLTLEPAAGHYGIHVGPHAFGPDLHHLGRATPILVDDENTDAQADLEHVWSLARPWAVRAGLETQRIEALIAGNLPLAVEQAAPSERPLNAFPPRRAPVRATVTLRGTVITAHWLTWETVVWRCQLAVGETMYAVVPRAQNAEFLDGVDGQRVEDLLRQEVRRSGRRRRLMTYEQSLEVGFWHEVTPEALFPLERNGIGRVPLAPSAPPRRGPGVKHPQHAGPQRRGSRARLSARTGH